MTHAGTLQLAQTPANLLPVEDDDDDDEDLDGGRDGARNHHLRLPVLQLTDVRSRDFDFFVIGF